MAPNIDHRELSKKKVQEFFNKQNLPRRQIEQQGGLDVDWLPKLEPYVQWLGQSGLLEKQGINPADVTFKKFISTQNKQIQLAYWERDLASINTGVPQDMAHNISIAAAGPHGWANVAADVSRKNKQEQHRSGRSRETTAQAGIPTNILENYYHFAFSHGKKPFPHKVDAPYVRERFFHDESKPSIEGLRATYDIYDRFVQHPETPPYTGPVLAGQPWVGGSRWGKYTSEAESSPVKVLKKGRQEKTVVDKEGQERKGYFPIITKANLPKAGPQEKVRLPQTTSTKPSEKPAAKPASKKVSVDPQLPVTQRQRLDIPVMEHDSNAALLKIAAGAVGLLPKILEAGSLLINPLGNYR